MEEILSSPIMGALVSFLITALLTYLELEETFYHPKKGSSKGKYYSFFFGFIIFNGILSIFLFVLLANQIGVEQTLLKGLVIGLAYQALVRMKIFTITIKEEKVPVGLEYIYDKIKRSMYSKINDIAKKARREEVSEKIRASSMEELVREAKELIIVDELLKPEDKKRLHVWIDGTYELWKKEQNESQKELHKYVIANFIISDKNDVVPGNSSDVT